jgi:very-short-patch-repair endonuclease
MIINQDFPNRLEGPFDSPIEEEFAYTIGKFLANGLEFNCQVELKTQIGNFRADFEIKSKNLRLLVELDGKEFHKGTKDLWRDSFILGEKHADLIIRFNGKDIVHNLSECCYILLTLCPDILKKEQ